MRTPRITMDSMYFHVFPFAFGPWLAMSSGDSSVGFWEGFPLGLPIRESGLKEDPFGRKSGRVLVISSRRRRTKF